MAALTMYTVCWASLGGGRAHREVPQYEEERDEVKGYGLHLDELYGHNPSDDKEDAEGCKSHVGIDHPVTLQTDQALNDSLCKSCFNRHSNNTSGRGD